MSDNSEIQTAIENIKSKMSKTKWVIGILGVMVLAPLTWILAYGILGLAAAGGALAVAGVVAATIWYGTEPFLMRLQNKRIQLIMEEATKNPIPTLWNEHAKDQKEVNDLEQAIIDYSTEIGNCISKKDKLVSKLKPEDIESFENDIRLMQEDLRLQEEDLQELKDGLVKQQAEIERASAIWDLGMAVSKANAKNLSAQRQETLSKIKRETALESVTSNMNRGKAQLRMRINSRRHIGGVTTDDQLAITSQTVQTLEIGTTRMRQQDKV